MGAGEPQPGFQFDLCRRNAFLEERGVHAPRLTKTGTTIAGIIFKARCCCCTKYLSSLASLIKQASFVVW